MNLMPIFVPMQIKLLTLINDLKSRGLLEDTLVVFGGEFGRTPTPRTKIKKSCRDHHHTAFSMMLAGAGLKGGFA